MPKTKRTAKLTDEFARAYRPTLADEAVWDENLTGFFLRAGGKRKLWCVYYRVPNSGTQRKILLGSVESLTEAKARREAQRILEDVRGDGLDPQLERKRKKQALRDDGAAARRAERRAAEDARRTLAVVAADYIAARKVKARPRTMDGIERHLTDHWKALRNKPIREIQKADVKAQLRNIRNTRGDVAHDRARATLHAFYVWAIDEEVADANPVASTSKVVKGDEADARIRTRVLSDSEIVEVWNNCENDDFGRIVKLLILTLQRRNEVSGIAKSELDIARRTWLLPAARSKNRREHSIPISDAALKVISGALDNRVGFTFLFGAKDDRPYSGFSAAKRRLDDRILQARAAASATGMAERMDWDLHDLRRTGITGLAKLSVSIPVIEKIANHRSGVFGGIVKTYQHHDFADEKRAALDRWGSHIEALIAGVPATILPMTKRA